MAHRNESGRQSTRAAQKGCRRAVGAAVAAGVIAVAGRTPAGPAAATGTAAYIDSKGRIVYSAKVNGNSDIFIANADGSQPQNLIAHPAHDNWPSVAGRAEDRLRGRP
jgi:hypothetical protein